MNSINNAISTKKCNIDIYIYVAGLNKLLVLVKQQMFEEVIVTLQQQF